MKHLFSTRFLQFVLSLSLLASVCELRAQVGDNNPTGPAGIFNGQITTGGSYDPYTGNVKRVVPDITVAGAVGTYGLAFSRIYNSRIGGGITFGASGWRHSYEWKMDDSAVSATPGVQPTSYTVEFPDGRSETFVYSATDPYYRTTAGVRDRFQPLN